MKKCWHASAVAVFLSVNVAVAQEYVPTLTDIKHFAATKTMMVKENNPLSEYNFLLEEIIPREWNITPYDFLTWKNFESKKSDESLSFLLMNQVFFVKDKSNTPYLFMSLVLGGKAGVLSDMPDMCSVPLAYWGAKEETYLYKLEIFLRFIQQHVRLITEHPEIASKNIFEYYNKNVLQLSGKTLYITVDELSKDVNTEAKIKKVYDGSFKIVTREEISKAIADRDPNVVFLHKVGPGKGQKNARCFKILVGVADAQFYYFDYHKTDDKTPDAFLASDFKKLSRKN
ncbi:MAG: hypothetical protein LBS09_02400 [Bacteroidales bacterium]|nr:hypothetical protein [Bacteroidales bacterium]